MSKCQPREQGQGSTGTHPVPSASRAPAHHHTPTTGTHAHTYQTAVLALEQLWSPAVRRLWSQGVKGLDPVWGGPGAHGVTPQADVCKVVRGRAECPAAHPPLAESRVPDPPARTPVALPRNEQHRTCNSSVIRQSVLILSSHLGKNRPPSEFRAPPRPRPLHPCCTPALGASELQAPVGPCREGKTLTCNTSPWLFWPERPLRGQVPLHEGSHTFLTSQGCEGPGCQGHQRLGPCWGSSQDHITHHHPARVGQQPVSQMQRDCESEATKRLSRESLPWDAGLGNILKLRGGLPWKHPETGGLRARSFWQVCLDRLAQCLRKCWLSHQQLRARGLPREIELSSCSHSAQEGTTWCALPDCPELAGPRHLGLLP